MRKSILFLFRLALVVSATAILLRPGYLYATSYGIDERILFEANSSEIPGKYKADLEKVSKVAQKPYWKITIRGNGNAEEKDVKVLAQKRAENVKAYLVQLGADPARLSVVSDGDRLPVADPKTEEGKAKNRYVDFSLTPLWDKMSDEEYKRLFGR